MMRHTLTTSFVLVVVVVLGLAGPGIAAEQVSFSGSLEGSTTTTPLTPPLLAIVLTCSGEASHLGKCTFTMPHVINPLTMTGSGTFEFVAANGDTLFGNGTGVASLTGTFGVVSIVEDLVITGGTGRFEGATGAFQTHRIYNRLTALSTGTFSGTVSAPGAAH